MSLQPVGALSFPPGAAVAGAVSLPAGSGKEVELAEELWPWGYPRIHYKYL